MYDLNESQPSGPDMGNLRTAFGMLPSLAKGIVEKKTVGKGTKVKPLIAPLKPTKVCECCSLLFQFQRDYEGEIQSAVCAKCQKSLDQGFTCFVSADRYAFGKSTFLHDMEGKLVQITEKTMDQLKKRFEVMSKEKNDQPPSAT